MDKKKTKDIKKKYLSSDEKIYSQFINNGYVIIKNSIEKKIINDLYKLYSYCFNRLHKLYLKKKIKKDYELWSIITIKYIQQTPTFKKYIRSPKIISILKNLLGPDICCLGYTSLWVNRPDTRNTRLSKPPHVDAWTGTSINTIMLKVYLTDVDKYNGLTVYPGSHLNGMLPVKNRILNDEDYNIKFDSVNLDNMKKGDIVIWHSLSLHRTTGHSKKNVRVSMTTRYTSTETNFSSQEKALGFQTLTVGSMNQVKRLIGNDELSPFRIYGGVAAIDKRLKDLYDINIVDGDGTDKYVSLLKDK